MAALIDRTALHCCMHNARTKKTKQHDTCTADRSIIVNAGRVDRS